MSGADDSAPGGSSVVYMANQIAKFFQSQGDRDSAVAGVAGHIKDFWTPSMRRDAIARIDQGTAAGLSEIARDAILSLR